MSIFDLDFGGGPSQRQPEPKRQKTIDEEVEELLEDSDDGEELIEYRANEPELRYRRDCEADVEKQLYLRAWCMTWARRKKVHHPGYLMWLGFILPTWFIVSKLP